MSNFIKLLNINQVLLICWIINFFLIGTFISPIDINNLPLNDKETFKLLQRGLTTGVFQLESRGMKEYLKQLKPNDFEDIVSMNALYRPGALGMNMVDSYIDRKKSMLDKIIKEA